MSTQKEEHQSRNVSSADPQCRRRPRRDLRDGGGDGAKVHTHRGSEDKRYLSVQSCIPYIYLCLPLFQTETFLGDTERLSPVVVPLLPGSAPITGPRCNPQLFIVRISKRSRFLINISCFSAPPAQGILHKRGPWEVRLIAVQRNDQGPQTVSVSSKSKRLLLSCREKMVFLPRESGLSVTEAF